MGLKLEHAQNHPEGSLNADRGFLPHRVCDSVGQGWGFAFPTSSQVRLRLLVWGPHFEDPCSKGSQIVCSLSTQKCFYLVSGFAIKGKLTLSETRHCLKINLEIYAKR